MKQWDELLQGVMLRSLEAQPLQRGGQGCWMSRMSTLLGCRHSRLDMPEGVLPSVARCCWNLNDLAPNDTCRTRMIAPVFSLPYTPGLAFSLEADEAASRCLNSALNHLLAEGAKYNTPMGEAKYEMFFTAAISALRRALEEAKMAAAGRCKVNPVWKELAAYDPLADPFSDPFFKPEIGGSGIWKTKTKQHYTPATAPALV